MNCVRQPERWSSRLGFVFAAVGGAVGLGNIWKFPYLTGSNGGGAFVLVYLLAVIAVAVPILIAELALGRRGQGSPPTAVYNVARDEGRSTLWASIGWLGTAVGFLILSFYSVIGGWVLDYLAVSAGGFHHADGGQAAARFQQLLDRPARMIAGHSLFMALTAYIVSRGLHRGIERVTSILMPALFVMLVGLAGYAAVAGDVAAALRYMFVIDFGKVSPPVVLAAVGQAFFSIGVSMGLMMAYGAYLPRDISIPRTALVIAGADTLVAIFAGIAIFPIVFGNALLPGEGPGLIFVTLPLAFSSMPGGTVVGGVFFLLLLVAALTSSIAILEPIVAWAAERRRVRRRLAAAVFGLAAWLLGVACALSFNVWSEARLPTAFGPFAQRTLFDALDYLTSNLLMPLGGILIAIFAGWKMRRGSLLAEFGWPRSGPAFHLWRWLLRALVPLAVGAVLLAGL